MRIARERTFSWSIVRWTIAIILKPSIENNSYLLAYRWRILCAVLEAAIQLGFVRNDSNERSSLYAHYVQRNTTRETLNNRKMITRQTKRVVWRFIKIILYSNSQSSGNSCLFSIETVAVDVKPFVLRDWAGNLASHYRIDDGDDVGGEWNWTLLNQKLQSHTAPKTKQRNCIAVRNLASARARVIHMNWAHKSPAAAAAGAAGAAGTASS